MGLTQEELQDVEGEKDTRVTLCDPTVTGTENTNGSNEGLYKKEWSHFFA